MLFLQGKDILGNIFFCINLIINDSSPSYVNYGNSNELDLNRYPYHHDFTDMIWIYYSIIKEDLVRKENIVKYIKSNINKKIDFKSRAASSDKDSFCIDRKRMWINEFTGSLDRDSSISFFALSFTFTTSLGTVFSTVFITIATFNIIITINE